MTTTNEHTEREELIRQFEQAVHRKGELWDRFQGKGWPQSESDEFHKLRDETIPTLRAAMLEAQPAPVDMVLYCPKCHTQHIDAPDERTPDWTNPPHKSHLCHGCGHIWRPSDTPTNGVKATASGKDADTAPAQPAEQANGAVACGPHPDAPHGFDRNASHTAGRYVCECESWRPVSEVISVETLAGMFRDENTSPDNWGHYHAKGWNAALRQAMDYATTPPTQPAREWVGLTDVDIYDAVRPALDPLAKELGVQLPFEKIAEAARAIESKLREKNAGQPAAEDRSSCCGHASDCAVHNEPAYPSGPCDCGLQPAAVPLEMIVDDVFTLASKHRVQGFADDLVEFVRDVLASATPQGATDDHPQPQAEVRVPDGYALVPVEPTREMIDAYLNVNGKFHSARADWKAMLAAAPKPQPQAEVRVPDGWINEVADLHCPNAYGFEGADTFPDCGQCIVCRAKAIRTAAPKPQEPNQ